MREGQQTIDQNLRERKEHSSRRKKREVLIRTCQMEKGRPILTIIIMKVGSNSDRKMATHLEVDLFIEEVIPLLKLETHQRGELEMAIRRTITILKVRITFMKKDFTEMTMTEKYFSH